MNIYAIVTLNNRLVQAHLLKQSTYLNNNNNNI